MHKQLFLHESYRATHMESASRAKYQKLILMLETFVAGESTSHQFIKDMEGEFWACGLNEDVRFSDLMMALDMFGVPREDFGYDEKELTSQCRYASRLLKDEP